MDSQAARIGSTAVFSVLAITGVIGNILVCLLISRNQNMRNPRNYLLINLAIADMLVVLFITPRFILIHFFKHPAEGMDGTLFCKLLAATSCTWIAGTASVFTLVSIAFERYHAVMHPNGNRGKITTNKLKIVVPASWITGAILNVPLFLTVNYNNKVDLCTEFWPRPWMPKAYSLMWFVILGVIPVVLMTVLYSSVVYSLWFKRKDHNENIQQGVMKIRKKVSKMVLAVSVIYGLGFVPTVTIYVMNYFSSTQKYLEALHITSIVLVSFNSSVNPFIYALVSQQFRQMMKGIVFCKGDSRISVAHHFSTDRTRTQQAWQEE